jgi:hypothetical protein
MKMFMLNSLLQWCFIHEYMIYIYCDFYFAFLDGLLCYRTKTLKWESRLHTNLTLTRVGSVSVVAGDELTMTTHGRKFTSQSAVHCVDEPGPVSACDDEGIDSSDFASSDSGNKWGPYYDGVMNDDDEMMMMMMMMMR